jgi:hypothetical protein
MGSILGALPIIDYSQFVTNKEKVDAFRDLLPKVDLFGGLIPSAYLDGLTPGAAIQLRIEALALSLLVSTAPPIPPTVNVTPGVLWTGTADSSGASPVDSSVAGRRAAMRLVEPPNQIFGPEGLNVGVQCFVEGGGTMSVICEGREFPLALRRRDYISNLDGSTQTVWAYWFTLNHADWPMNGIASFSFKCVPNDTANYDTTILSGFTYERATVQHPFTYYIKPSLGADNAATREYRTLTAALTNAGFTNSRWNSEFLLMENGDYDFDRVVNFKPTGARGFFKIRCGPGVTARFSRTGTPASMRPSAGPIRLQGPRLSIDLASYLGDTLYRDTNDRASWLDGVRITSYGRDYNGANQYAEKSLIANTAATTLNSGWVTECKMSDAPFGLTGPINIRNSEVYNIAGDMTQYSYSIYGLIAYDQDPTFYRTERAAMTLTYAGAAATATYTKIGANGVASTLPLRTDGTVVATITLSVGKTVAAVVDEINALGLGFTAATSADHAFWDATRLTAPGTVSYGAVTNPVSVKNVVVQLVTANDMHGDLIQQPPNGSVYANIRAWLIRAAQGLFMANATGGIFNDVYIVNYAVDCGGLSAGLSQIGSNCANVHIWHITELDQQVRYRTGVNFTARNSTRNSVVRSIAFDNAPDTDMVVADNHVWIGGGFPSNAVRTTEGGSKESLVVNALAGNFTPAGELLLAANRVAPLVPFDLNNNVRGLLAAKGAVA